MDKEEGDVHFFREELNEIPDTVFSEGENVKRLYLFENELTSLPSEISRLTNLKYINVSNNRITFIPREIGQLVNLKKIHISSNLITSFPPEFWNLVNLIELGVSYNQITYLPSAIGRLISLEQLWISSNQLTFLPKELGELRNLNLLDVSRNQLTSIPDEIGDLVNLKELNVSFNQLASLPSGIGELVNLEKLWLGDNLLTSFPPVEKLVNLEKLDISSNQIKVPVNLYYKLHKIHKILVLDKNNEIIGGVKGLYFNEDGPFSRDSYIYKSINKEDQNLSEKEKEVLKLYTYQYDEAINSSLRKNEASEFVYEIIKSIIDVVKKVQPLQPLLLYRGINPWMDLDVGMKFSDLGFSSKSYNLRAASKFLGDTCCMLVLGYTKPSHHLFMEDVSKFPKEKELLTFPGEQFEVVEVGETTNEYNQTVKAYYCRYIGNIYNGDFDIKVNPSIDTDFEKYIVPVISQISKSTVLCLKKGETVYKFGSVLEKPSLYKIKAVFHSPDVKTVYLIKVPLKEEIPRATTYTTYFNGLLTTNHLSHFPWFITALSEMRVTEVKTGDVFLEIPKAQIVWNKT
jgi:hypothetical protein